MNYFIFNIFLEIFQTKQLALKIKRGPLFLNCIDNIHVILSFPSTFMQLSEIKWDSPSPAELFGFLKFYLDSSHYVISVTPLKKGRQIVS